MNAETFYRKRLIELSDSKTMEKINSIVELKKQAQICQEYHEYKLKLLIIGDVMGRLSLAEIENTVLLKHSDDWEYGNDKKRCEELKEDTRNLIGYTKTDVEAYL